MLSLGGVALLGGVCVAALRRFNGEVSLLLSVAVCAVLVMGISDVFREVWALVGELSRLAGVDNTLLRPVLKCAGISLLCGICSQICRDAGAGSIAMTVQLCGTVCGLYAALPLIHAVLGLIAGLL